MTSGVRRNVYNINIDLNAKGLSHLAAIPRKNVEVGILARFSQHKEAKEESFLFSPWPCHSPGHSKGSRLEKCAN